MKPRPFLWFILFALLFTLALDYWRWTPDITLGGLNFPVWLFYFVGLQVALTLSVFGFIRTVWTGKS